LQDLSGKILKLRFSATLTRSRSREFSRLPYYYIKKSLGFQVLKNPRDKISKKQSVARRRLRDNKTMAKRGEPNAGELKLMDVNEELVKGVKAHVGNEEMPLALKALKEEKCRISIRPEPIAVLLRKIFNLGLREAEFPYVSRKRTKHLRKGRILRHLVHIHRRFNRRPVRFVGSPIF